MGFTYTRSETTTFSLTHARHLAAKVATDLKRMQRFYGAPSDTRIAAFETEVTLLLKEGYLGIVTFGFRRRGAWIEPTIRYTARELAGGSADDHDPGRVRPGADTRGASFYSYLTHSPAWDYLTSDQRRAFKEQLPIHRNGAPEPAVDGYLRSDRTYSSGGRALDRASVRAF